MLIYAEFVQCTNIKYDVQFIIEKLFFLHSSRLQLAVAISTLSYSPVNCIKLISFSPKNWES